MREGKVLPVMEEFYTLQGEGFNTGQAAYFIRVGGCDVGCKWCDVKESWNACDFPPVSTDLVVTHAMAYPAKAIVVTGGEPLLYNMDYLCDELHRRDIRIFLETSGSQPLSGTWDWICLSPKKQQPPIDGIHMKADELKVIISSKEDLDWAEINSNLVKSNCQLFLQPEWSNFNVTIQWLTDYVMYNPKWKINCPYK